MDITTLGAAVAMAKKVMPQVTSADAGKLATVDSNGKWAAAELEVGQGEVAVDTTLLVSGAAADAKVTGNKITDLKSAIDDLNDEYYLFDVEKDKYVDTNDGVLSPYAGWDTTELLPLKDDPIIITNTVRSIYNGYYGDDGVTYKGNFSLEVGNNSIKATATKKYIRISNTAAAIKAMKIKYPATDTTLKQADVPADAKATGDAINAINPYYLPGYWESYLATKIPQVQNKCLENGRGECFIYFTDEHYDTSAKKSAAIIRNIRKQTPIDTCVFGGDILNISSSQTETEAKQALFGFYKDYLSQGNMLTVIGNHEVDAYNSSTSAAFTKDEIYAVLTKPMEKVTNTNGHFYYSYKNESTKVKYIILDTETAGFTQSVNKAQVDWMIAELGEMQEGWTAILFAHTMFKNSQHQINTTNAPIYEIANAYNQRTTWTGSHSSADFTNVSGNVACLIVGHCHYDYSTTEYGLLIIATTTDSIGGGNADFDDPPRTSGVGTIEEHAFDLFFVDTTNKTIKTIRIGYGSDRIFDYDPESETYGEITT